MVRKYPGHRIVRLKKAVVMPGLVNVHAHLELPPLLDHIQARNYTGWVLNLLRQKKHLIPRDYTSAAQRNVSSLLRSGTTTVADISTHGFSSPVLWKSGLRAVIFQELISMEQAPRRVIIPRRLFRSSSRVRFGLSPHSPHTVSEAIMRAVRSYADRKHIGICMHVAETRDEMRLLQREKSDLERLYAAAGWELAMAPEARSSFELLSRIGILSPAFLAVHAVHADDRDIALIKRSGAAVAHCPRSNHALRVGHMPLRKMLDAGIPVGLGTDSLASVPTMSLWDEMRFAYKLHRKNGVSLKDIFHMATMGGAWALGMDHEIGSLEPGKKADIIAVPLPLRNTGDIYSDLLRETESSIMTMVKGKIIFRTDRVEEE